MPNDLRPWDGGSIAPYQPASGGLPASSPAGSGADYLTEYSSNQTPQLFGIPLPAGATAHHAEAALSQIAAIFANDAKQLGASPQFINEAIKIFKQLAVSSKPNEVATHGYDLSNLPPIPNSDAPFVIAFLNQMRREGFDQEDVRKAVYWLGLLYQKAGHAQQQTASTNAISDAEFKRIAKNNDQAIQSCENELRARWGNQYRTNLEIVKRYVLGLSAPERERLETAVIDNRMAFNHPGVIEGLFKQAIASTHVPGSAMPAGTSLQDERKAIEDMMRNNRKKYNASPEIQSRYRAIIDLMNGS